MRVMQKRHEPKLYWNTSPLCNTFLLHPSIFFFFHLKESRQHFRTVGLANKSFEHGECWLSQDNSVLFFKKYPSTVHFHRGTGQIGSSKGSVAECCSNLTKSTSFLPGGLSPDSAVAGRELFKLQ